MPPALSCTLPGGFATQKWQRNDMKKLRPEGTIVEITCKIRYCFLHAHEYTKIAGRPTLTACCLLSISAAKFVLGVLSPRREGSSLTRGFQFVNSRRREAACLYVACWKRAAPRCGRHFETRRRRFG